MRWDEGGSEKTISCILYCDKNWRNKDALGVKAAICGRPGKCVSYFWLKAKIPIIQKIKKKN